jgi:hypothetical protein
MCRSNWKNFEGSEEEWEQQPLPDGPMTVGIESIAAATDLSSSRIHQVLNSENPAKLPIWATRLRNTAEEGKEKCLTDEVRLLRQCAHWLNQLEGGEDVCVNLRPDDDPETEYVRFDRGRVIRILDALRPTSTS